MVRHTGGLLAMGGDTFGCIGCHSLPTGTDRRILPPIIAGGWFSPMPTISAPSLARVVAPLCR